MVFMPEKRRPSAELLTHMAKARASVNNCLRLCRRIELVDRLRGDGVRVHLKFMAILKAEAERLSAELRTHETDCEQICRNIADVAYLCGDTQAAARWTADANAIADRLRASETGR